ncbi:MAG TPA: DUF692 domain-containing protein [Polyangiaceae bacterium]|nr:DUF692 domain-containing protein [Polyangiaceae bacterium]
MVMVKAMNLDLGVGVGLRVPHYAAILAERPSVDFFEVISENFMVEGGKPLHHLERVLEHYPVVQHGVSLGIAGPAAPDRDYLERLKRLVKRTKTPWVSDHFCWSSAGGAHLHDLLPIPYTAEAVRRVTERARMIQDFLEVPFALENTSSYLTYRSSTLSEWEFIGEIAERADIGLLFDVNNVYVSAYNHGFDAETFVRSVPHERILQIHLAGHTNLGKYIIDTHRGSVTEPVFDLYRQTIALTGPVSTLIEWDDEIPELPVLLAEAERARQVRNEGLALREGRALPVSSAPASAEVAPIERAGWKQGGPRESAASEVVG